MTDRKDSFDNLTATELREQILAMSAEYARREHGQNRPADDPDPPKFVAGETTIPYAARVFDEAEVVAAVDSTLDFWLTLGKEGEKFETSLAEILDVRRSLLVNSGSSANLLALSALTSPKLPRDRRIGPGDEVISVAAGFPTTVSPIIQAGATAVFIDADPLTGNPRVDQLETALGPRTKAVMFAHALGNPFNLVETLRFCRAHDLWLIEDNCDALGSRYSMPTDIAVNELGWKRPGDGGHCPNDYSRPTGSWGDLSTQSFYPPHHMTLGEGGAVNIVRQAALKPLVESFRDWGRDCWCPSGKDDTCNKRFGWRLGELPEGYDHKYIYGHLGYNLKPLDVQAAIGRRQIEKLPSFVKARRQNWQRLRAGLADLEPYIEFSLPTHATAWNTDGSFRWDDSGCRTECSWFGFKMAVRPDAPFTRTQLAQFLDKNRIGNRMLFGGNLLRQPAFVALRRDRPDAVRTVGEMTGADQIMNHTLFIGTFPGMTEAMIDFVVERMHDFVGEAKKRSASELTAA